MIKFCPYILWIWFSTVCGWGALYGQTPFSRQVVFNDNPAGRSTMHRVRDTPDGGTIVMFNTAGAAHPDNFTGFVKVNSAGQVTESWAIPHTVGAEHRIWDIIELADGRRICLIHIDVDFTTGNIVSSYQLRLYGPNMEDIWSANVGGSWAAPDEYPPLTLDAFGNVYGATGLGGFNPATFFFKVPLGEGDGWVKTSRAGINSMVPDREGGIMVAFAPSQQRPTSMLMRYDRAGKLYYGARVRDLSIKDLQLMPNGDILSAGRRETPPFEKFILRLDINFQIRGNWLLENINLEEFGRNLLVVNDDLIYYFARPSGGEDGRVALRLNGRMEVQKAVLIPFENGPPLEPARWGPNGAALSGRFRINNIERARLLRFDTSLTTPGCIAHPYCVRTVGLKVFLDRDSFTLPERPIEKVRNSPTPFRWEKRQVALQDPGCPPPPNRPSATFQMPDTVCMGVPVQPRRLKQQNATEWRWSFEQGSPDSSRIQQPSVTWNRAGTFRVTQFIRYQGCFSDFSAGTVRVLPAPLATLGPDTLICDRSQVQLTVKGANITNLLWDNGSTGRTRIVDTAGTYSVLATDAFCPVRDTIKVKFVNTRPGFATKDTICIGETIDLVSDNDYWDGLHTWNISPKILDRVTGVNPSGLLPPRPGTYTITHGIRTQGCNGQAERKVAVMPLPVVELGRDTIICRDSVINLKPNITAGVNFKWSDNQPALARKVTRPGFFRLNVDDGRCRNVDDITIGSGNCVIPIVYIPNIFSPNGDGFNDLFSIGLRNAKKIVAMHIFDRWGTAIWQQAADNPTWDGNGRDGQPVATGIYICQFNILRNDGAFEWQTGEVMVVR